jgi:hypothetical protein
VGIEVVGCDIYMHAQAKIDGKWIWYDQNIFDGRNYELFDALDGCRSDKKHKYGNVFPRKGFPKDSDDKLKEPDHWDNDYWTESGVYLGYAGVSYLSLTELKTFEYWSEVSKTFSDEVMPYLEAVAEKYGGPDNARIVFGYGV